MSGTSMDGVDTSLIRSDGYDEFACISDEYYAYSNNLQEELISIRNLIINHEDLFKYSKELNDLERKITLFHADKVKQILLKYKNEIDLIGFHGQTIFHNPLKKISKQLGDGKLLYQLVKKNIVYDFRQNDIENNGQGAPLTPIFHFNLSKNINEKFKIELPIGFINIGGITNGTKIIDHSIKLENNIIASDLGPGNCMIDEWIRKNSKKNLIKMG
jgi:anhydro-N-acetylmuramic acid kinase